MDLGATLRQAREARGLACEDVARTTRIPVRMILAMERDDWAKLPGGIFTRGYLRAYAREIGIDGEPLVAQYEAEHAPPPPPPAQREDSPEMRATVGEWRVVVRVPRWKTGPSGAWTRLGWPALAAGSLLVLYLASGSGPQDGDRGAGPAGRGTGGTVPTSSLGAQQGAPVGTTAAGGEREPGDIALPSPGIETIALDVAVTRPCWVAVTVDGVRTVYRIVQPGEHERQQGREFIIRVGDAEALQLSLDGERTRPLGASGEVLTIRITRENYRSLLPAGVLPL